MIAITFFVLAAYVTVEAGRDRLAGQRAAHSPVGIVFRFPRSPSLRLRAAPRHHVVTRRLQTFGRAQSRPRPA